jgi:hypothetical protein
VQWCVTSPSTAPIQALWRRSTLSYWVCASTDRWKTTGLYCAAEEDRTPKLAFCGVQNYQPPRWPDPERDYPQQAHLDLIVDDLAAAEQLVLNLGGATLALKDESIPAAQRINKDVYPINIYADPVGHPFCMMAEGSPWWHSASLGNFAPSSGR